TIVILIYIKITEVFILREYHSEMYTQNDHNTDVNGGSYDSHATETHCPFCVLSPEKTEINSQ
ncbi:TPA: hypothetical protein ACLGZT_004667, partial [Salmonella enterica]